MNTDASDRLTKFCDEYIKMRGLDPDLVYGLHRGDDDSECAVTITDLRSVLSELATCRKRLGVV